MNFSIYNKADEFSNNKLSDSVNDVSDDDTTTTTTMMIMTMMIPVRIAYLLTY